MYVRDVVVGVLMLVVMIVLVECFLFFFVVLFDVFVMVSFMNGEECMLVVDMEDRLSLNLW